MTDRNLLEMLAAGESFVSDGATGTNLQKMGLPVGAAAELWVLENPEAIINLNRAFIEAEFRYRSDLHVWWNPASHGGFRPGRPI